MLDILIKNGFVLDGTGKKAYKSDLGIAEGRIVKISPHIELQASQTIEAQGLHLAPGFIDAHTHSDITLLVDPRGQSKIHQGVTTEIIGNCGYSPAPLSGMALEEIQAEMKRYGGQVTWTSIAGYVERMRKQGTALNVVPLVGHNTVRASVLGYENVQPDPTQLTAMEQLVEEAMEQGARGLSTGLFYPPGFYAPTEEVVKLARVTARHGGIYASHIRNESDRLLEAVVEAIRIGREAEIPVQISHIKLDGYRNWDGIDKLLALLEDAISEGLKLGCDQYPYTAGVSWLAYILPYWAQAGGSKAITDRLSDHKTRDQLRRDWEQNRSEWEERSGMRDWSDLLITDCPSQPDAQGKNIAEISDEEGKDPLNVLFDLIRDSQSQVECACFGQLEDNVRILLQHPLVVVGSDGDALAPTGILSEGKPHPRYYGTFPRILGKYVREEKVLTLEEAVQKMTATTAQRFSLTGRGVIQESAWADLVLFDSHTVKERATFSDPHQFPDGLPYVIVNGVVVIEEAEHTGALPGQVL